MSESYQFLDKQFYLVDAIELNNLAQIVASKMKQEVAGSAYTYAGILTTITNKFFSDRYQLVDGTLSQINEEQASVIRPYAFYSLSSLEQATFSNASSIGQGAFSSCASLTSISASKATEVGNMAFFDCTSLTDVYLPEANTKIATNDIFNAATKKVIKNLTIGDNNDIAGFGNNTAANVAFSAIEKVTMNKASGTVAVDAFNNCYNLKEINLPKATALKNTNNIGRNFKNCSALTVIDLPKVTGIIPASAFENCSALTTLNLPATTSKLNQVIFGADTSTNAYRTSNLTDFTCGCNEITNMLGPAKTNLTSISFSKCEIVGEKTFQDCTNLANVYMPKVTNIGAEAFSNTALILPENKDSEVNDGSNIYSGLFPAALTIKANAFANISTLIKLDNQFFYNKEILGQQIHWHYRPSSTPLKFTNEGIFSSCSNLTEVDLKIDGITAKSIFSNCGNLKTITLDVPSITTTDYIFGTNSNSTTVKYPYENFTLNNCSEITPNYTFANAVNLTNFVAPNLTKINGIKTFKGCSNLVYGSFPEATTLGQAAFNLCTAITKVTDTKPSTARDSEGNEYLIENVIYLPKLTKLETRWSGDDQVGMFEGCVNLTDVSLANVTEMQSRTFSNCENLQNVNLPKIANTLNQTNYFTNCTNLNTVILSASLSTTAIGTIFPNCQTSLSSVILNASRINGTFNGFTALSCVALPLTDNIGANSFSGCTKITKITNDINPSNSFENLAEGELRLPAYNSNTEYKLTLGTGVFKECTGLLTACLDNVTALPADTFSGCINLGTLTAKKTTAITGNAFRGCASLSYISLPEITTIGNNVFTQTDTKNNKTQATSIATITTDSTAKSGLFVPKLTTLGTEAFKNCTNLTKADLPNVTSIGTNGTPFYGCTNLSEVNLSSLKTLVANMFYGCSLKSVNVAAATTIPINVFTGFTQLTEINSAATDKSALTINAATTINNTAFSGCTGLTTVNLPEGLTTIGTYAFSGCTALNTFVAPGVTTLNANIFYNCAGLNCIKLPKLTAINAGIFTQTANNVKTDATNITTITDDIDSKTGLVIPAATTIAEGAFENCSKLTKANLPKGLTAIGKNAFKGCNNLSQIYIYSNDGATTFPTLGTSAFYNTDVISGDDNTGIYTDNVGTLQGTKGWDQYANYIHFSSKNT